MLEILDLAGTRLAVEHGQLSAVDEFLRKLGESDQFYDSSVKDCGAVSEMESL